MHEPALWVGIAGFLAATLFFAYRGMTARRAGTGPYYWGMVLVGGAGTVTYVLLGLGLGSVAAGAGRAVPVVRFADWLVSTTLVLVLLWRLADADRTAVGALLALDVLWIAVTAASAVLTRGLGGLPVGRSRLAGWGLGGLLLLAALGVLVRRLGPRAGRQHRDVAVLFSVLRNLVVVAWLAYHLAWVTSPVWLGLLDGLGAAAAFVVVDLVGRVGFGLILLRDGETLERA